MGSINVSFLSGSGFVGGAGVRRTLKRLESLGDRSEQSRVRFDVEVFTAFEIDPGCDRHRPRMRRRQLQEKGRKNRCGLPRRCERFVAAEVAQMSAKVVRNRRKTAQRD